MKKHGILNSSISKVLADMGHTDTIVIGDAGLPVPAAVQKIDLALTPGFPDFQRVVSAVKEDMMIEGVIVAEEMVTANEPAHAFMKELFEGTDIQYISHEELKQASKHAKAVIRTGETTPYANCILRAGVFF
ncbi:D-ribose pyranase [Bacillus testis]|uniref:D-ribose pyranase n=1 Tax=Bacillus testis TaxID=1622072 RepID=UPI00067F48C6|nr:D-ribose pyranase [Bacillus testis]